MTQPLKPADMQSLLTHDQRYHRALAVLKGQWLPIIAEEDRPFRQQIAVADLQFAKALLASGSAKSAFDFTSYAGVQQLRQHFGNQLNAAAQQWLIKPYL